MAFAEGDFYSVINRHGEKVTWTRSAGGSWIASVEPESKTSGRSPLGDDSLYHHVRMLLEDDGDLAGPRAWCFFSSTGGRVE